MLGLLGDSNCPLVLMKRRIEKFFYGKNDEVVSLPDNKNSDAFTYKGIYYIPSLSQIAYLKPSDV